MADDDHARMAHSNLVDAFAVLTRYQSSGFLHQAGGVVVAATGSPVAFFNEVVPVAADVGADELIEAVGIVERAGLPWMAHLRDGIDDPLVDTLGRLGLVEDDDDYPAMVSTAVSAHVPTPAGLEVARVADAAEFDVYLRLAAEIAGAHPDRFRTWLGAGIVDDSAVSLFTGSLDSTPVAVSMSVQTGTVVGVYNVATAPSARRRGIGWAMTAAATVAGIEAGAIMAILQSTPMAARMYAAHGFERLFRYRLFHRPT